MLFQGNSTQICSFPRVPLDVFSFSLRLRCNPHPCGYFGDPKRDLLENAMHQMNFSARAHDRILKVARTLADLAGHDDITSDPLLEAFNFRTLDRNLWV
jgi:Magnesium chelatase, subunit ChlI C-terminal